MREQERRRVAKSYKYRLPPEIGSDVEGGSGAGVSDAGVSGAGVSGAGVSGAGVSDTGVSGAGVSGAGVSDTSKVTYTASDKVKGVQAQVNR